MSAFMVEDETINKIVAGIKYSHEYGDNNGFPYLPKSLEAIVYQPRDAAIPWGDYVGNLLFNLNILGIEWRYGEGEAKEFRPLNYEFHTVLPPSNIHLYKTLQCFTYQCCEGDIPVTNELYKALEEWSDALAHHIVMGLKQYEMAKWG